ANIASGHKTSGPKDPRRKSRPFTCTSCHEPHSSDSIFMFRFKAKVPTDICVNCHERKMN
ncbi:MAG: cytochrome c3 family protein, partial [Gammaproteobacteria bacterium]|nr:cytochrome c3 family protein [Gammaproteobacteria bacterium]